MSATFEEWIEAVFDHPVGEPEWYWNEDFDSQWESLGMSDALTVSYLTRVFQGSALLKKYSLEQVAQAIWFLIGDASPAGSSYTLVKADVPLEARSACVQAMSDFFAEFVVPAAPGPADTKADPFHVACYMWWDIFPLCPTYAGGGPEAGEPDMHKACLKVMAEMLDLPSELCRLSALHGLNHWHRHYPMDAEQIIDTFLRKAGEVTPRIREYALEARQGLCL